MIKVYPLNNLPFSPFVHESGQTILAQYGIIITTNEMDANLIVSSSERKLLLYILKYGFKKKYLLWTDEPYLNTRFSPKITYPLLPTIHVLNVYTGIYRNNYRWIPDHIELSPISDFEFRNHKIVAIFGYGHNRKKRSIKYNGAAISLHDFRIQISLTGNELGIVDIYGRGWPEGISKGESREGDWRTGKLDLLRNYHFNLAFENTNFPYYCTEKIWDSIHAYCLPIYYGKGNAIYQDFPPNSFIDYSDFENLDDFFKYIQSMTTTEFLKRMNRCIEVFNSVVQRRLRLSEDFYHRSQKQLRPLGMQTGFMVDLATVTGDYIQRIF